MRILKKIGWSLLILVGIFVLTAGIFTSSLTPDCDGKQDLNGQSSEVNVHFDTSMANPLMAGRPACIGRQAGRRNFFRKLFLELGTWNLVFGILMPRGHQRSWVRLFRRWILQSRFRVIYSSHY